MSTMWVPSVVIKVPSNSSGVLEGGVINSTWCFQEITEEGALNLKGDGGQGGQGSEAHFIQRNSIGKGRESGYPGR